MNFDEFFPLLKSIFTKKSCNITPTAENFNTYLATRYISFYHPSLCEILNESVNKFDINKIFDDPEDGFKFLKALIPKHPYKHIKNSWIFSVHIKHFPINISYFRNNHTY